MDETGLATTADADMDFGSIPDEVKLAVQSLDIGPEAKNPLLRHKDAREICAILGLYMLDKRTGKASGGYTWAEMSRGLNFDFQGLESTPEKLRMFAERHLASVLVIPAGWARKALIEASGELNTAKSLLDLREQALAAIDKMRDKVGEFDLVEGKGGKMSRIPTGPTLGEFTKALKDAGELTEKFAKEAARFGLLPESKADRPTQLDINVHVGGRMGRAMGAPVDAEFKPV